MLNYDKNKIIEEIEREGLVLPLDSGMQDYIVAGGDIYLTSEQWAKIKKEIREL